MAKKKNVVEESPGWVQEFVLRIPGGFEISMDINELPNPKNWKEVPRPVKKTKDYYKVSIINRAIYRHFSPSTMTWYESEKPPYIPGYNGSDK